MERSHKQQMSVTLGPFQMVIVLLLIGGAYYLGNLKAKVDLLQGGAGTPTAAQPSAAAPNAAAPAAPLTADNVKKPSKEDWVKGDRNAEIMLIEYSDYECPFCKQFHPTAEKVVEEYKGKVAWIHRDYPLSFHQNAQKEAEASECIGSLGGNDAFWKYTDAIYERTTSNGTGFALDKLPALAKEVGVDEAKFKKCLDSGEMAAKVKADMDEGTAIGVNGTPGNVLLNVKTGKTVLIPGAVPFDQIKTEIDKLMNG